MYAMTYCILYFGFVHISIFDLIIDMNTLVDTIIFTDHVGNCTNNLLIHVHNLYLNGIDVGVKGWGKRDTRGGCEIQLRVYGWGRQGDRWEGEGGEKERKGKK